MILSLKDVGRRCKQFRVDRGYYQMDVATETGYSVENVSAFETGRNDNARILLWYFAHGMNYEDLLERGLNNGKDL